MARMIFKRYLLAPLLLLAGCSVEGPERVVERRTTSKPADRGVALLRAAMTSGHTRERSMAGVAIQEMARTRRFEHAQQPQGPSRQGENLWTGTRGAYRYDEMFGHWAAEQPDFVNGAAPGFSRTGRWQDVAHYTQIVWRTSQRVGCAMASNTTDDYLVCRYSPSGNVVGQRAS